VGELWLVRKCQWWRHHPHQSAVYNAARWDAAGGLIQLEWRRTMVPAYIRPSRGRRWLIENYEVDGTMAEPERICERVES